MRDPVNPNDRENMLDQLLQSFALDALICSLPDNVLLLTKYWPVTGNTLAVFCRGTEVGLLVPQDEQSFVSKNSTTKIIYYQPGSLDALSNEVNSAEQGLRHLLELLSFDGKNIGVDCGAQSVPSPYLSVKLFGNSLQTMIEQVIPESKVTSASDLLAEAKSMVTLDELQILRRACSIAQTAFLLGIASIDCGVPEFDIANNFRRSLSKGVEDTLRTDGFAFCMSGSNSALAYRAFANSTEKLLAAGELVMIHCNSYCGGFWTDITRTYCLGKPSLQIQKMRAAMMRARFATLESIRPGIFACEIDKVARDSLDKDGFGKYFKHATGHGVGFSACDASARPRIHPLSPDRIEEGSVFNIEPAIYIDSVGGMRHCDMVYVTSNGAELLTDFQVGDQDFIVPGSS